MTAPTTAEYLKFANVQMAAEALYDSDATLGLPLTPGKVFSGVIAQNVLINGNRHSSKFTATEAAKFAAEWEVVEHKSKYAHWVFWHVAEGHQRQPRHGH